MLQCNCVTNYKEVINMTKETKVMRLSRMEQNVIELLREKKEQVNHELRVLLNREDSSDFLKVKELKRIIEDRTFFNSEKFELDNMVELNILTENQSCILKEALAKNRNILIVGRTGAGKTTLLTAMLKYRFDNFPDRRTVLVEKTSELKEHVPINSSTITREAGGLKLSDLSFLNNKVSQFVISEINEYEDVQSIQYALDEGSSVIATMQGEDWSLRLKVLGENNISLKGEEFVVVNININQEAGREYSIVTEML